MATVAELVEPEQMRDRAGEYLQRAGEVLRAAGAVQLIEVESMRVTAEVQDGGERHVAELAATPDGLSIRCDCPGGGAHEYCPHTVATAIETWEQDLKRRG
jgi:uncharacterized Zn finger protein